MGARLLLTAATVLAIGGVGWAYALLTRPLLVPEVEAPRAIAAAEPYVRPTVTEISKLATGDGRPLTTISRPGPDGGPPRAFLQFATHENLPTEGEGLIRLTPFVFVYRGEVGEDGRRPEDLILRSESALIRSERPLSLAGGDGPGKITAAALEGEVHVTGPDGLDVTGRDFTFTGEDLYSDFPVAFSVGPSSDPAEDRTQVRGRADKLRVELTQAAPGEDGLLGGDLPPVAGVKTVQLRRDVVVDVATEERTSTGHPETNFLRITSDGRFEYRVAPRLASFEDNVVVTHAESPVDVPGPQNRLAECETLLLTLTPKTPESQTERTREKEPLDLDLELAGVRALGRRLSLRSDVEDLTAVGGDFSYDLRKRLATLTGGRAAANSAPPSVTVDVAGQRLFTPRAEIAVGDSGEGLRRIDCPGHGWFQTAERDPRTTPTQASWSTGLTVEPASEDGRDFFLVTASGDVRIVQEAEATEFTGPSLAFWVPADRTEKNVPPVHRVRADAGGRVRAKGVDVSAKTLLQVDVAEITRLSPGAIRQASGVAPAKAGPDSSPFDEPEETAAPPVVATADAIGLILGLTPETAAGKRDAELLSLTAEGAVNVLQPSESAAEPRLHVRGERASLLGRGYDQVLAVTGGAGEHLVLEGDGVRLAAASVRANRRTGTVEIPGGGTLLLPAGEDLSGPLGGTKSEDEPTKPAPPLRVTWKERMEAVGETVVFLGGVEIEQGETTLQCEKLTVVLSRPLDFRELDPDALRGEGDVEMRRIVLRHNVGLVSKEWDGTNLTTLRRASDLAMLSYDRATQAIAGQGPGTVEQWTRNNDDPRKRSPAGDWSYARLSFTGLLRGHAGRRWVSLDGGVRALHGRVDRPLAELTRDALLDVPGQPTEAAWLGCDRLEVLLLDKQPDAPEDALPAQVQASGHVELEGPRFRATSDTASVDGSSGLVKFRSDGDRVSSIWIQQQPGAAVTPTTARAIQFNPRTRTFETEGLKGLSGAAF